jgi:hypothetical protein
MNSSNVRLGALETAFILTLLLCRTLSTGPDTNVEITVTGRKKVAVIIIFTLDISDYFTLY